MYVTNPNPNPNPNANPIMPSKIEVLVQQFFLRYLDLGAQDHSPKKRLWRKIKTAIGRKTPWPRYTTRTTQNKKCRISDDFGLKRLVIQKPLRTKSDTSVVARI